MYQTSVARSPPGMSPETSRWTGTLLHDAGCWSAPASPDSTSGDGGSPREEQRKVRKGGVGLRPRSPDRSAAVGGERGPCVYPRQSVPDMLDAAHRTGPELRVETSRRHVAAIQQAPTRGLQVVDPPRQLSAQQVVR